MGQSEKRCTCGVDRMVGDVLRIFICGWARDHKWMEKSSRESV